MRKNYGFYLIELLVIIAIIGTITSLLFATRRHKAQAAKTANQVVAATNVNNAFVVPEVSTATKKPDGPLLDMATVNQSNPGYTLDMDGDGISDHVILKGDGIVYYAKGSSDGSLGSEIPILVIHGSLSAYCVFSDVNAQGKAMPKIRFFDDQRRGFYQWCLGTTAEGIPYFGNVEGD